jgi:hypothetical protein
MTRWFLLAVAAFAADSAFGQFVSFPNPGSATVNFDSLASSGANLTWTNGVTVNGVYAFRSNGNGAVTTYDTSDGSLSNAGQYSFGSSGSAERALGAISGSPLDNLAFGVVVQNTSAEPLMVSLAYTGEQWRNSGTATQNVLNFSYRNSAIAPTDVLDWSPEAGTPAGYTNLDALDFTGPISGGTDGALDGNAAANRQAFGSTVVTTIDPGQYAVFRWYHQNNDGFDHGLAIDDLVITAAPIPEPSIVLGLAALALGGGTWLRRRCIRGS